MNSKDLNVISPRIIYVQFTQILVGSSPHNCQMCSQGSLLKHKSDHVASLPQSLRLLISPRIKANILWVASLDPMYLPHLHAVPYDSLLFFKPSPLHSSLRTHTLLSVPSSCNAPSLDICVVDTFANLKSLLKSHHRNLTWPGLAS